MNKIDELTLIKIDLFEICRKNNYPVVVLNDSDLLAYFICIDSKDNCKINLIMDFYSEEIVVIKSKNKIPMTNWDIQIAIQKHELIPYGYRVYGDVVNGEHELYYGTEISLYDYLSISCEDDVQQYVVFNLDKFKSLARL